MLQSMLFPAAIYALMLFVPGYLFLRCMGLPFAWALCCSPILSTFLTAVCGEVYAACGIGATPIGIYAPIVLIPLVALLARRMLKRPLPSSQQRSHRRRTAKRHASASTAAPDTNDDAQLAPIDWWMPFVFFAVGILICNNLFVSELPSLDAILQNYDVQHHINVTKAFVDARRISSLGVSFFATEADAAIMPFGYASFYPAIWYGQCSLLVQATGLDVPSAINVSLASTLALAYPVGMCAFAASVFRRRRPAIGFCALTCVGFAMFPWCLLIFGPLYPNLVGFALMPATAALCVRAFQFGLSLRERVIAWVVVLAALVGQALLQPNTLFSLFMILVPYVAQQTYTLVYSRSSSILKAAAATVVFLAVCLAFWTMCYKMPLFDVVIREFWPRFAYPWQEVVNILTQTYTLFFFAEISAQVLLGILVIIGFVCTFYNMPSRWLAVSYVVLCLINLINATTYNSALKRFVAGFWYTDAMRLAAMAIVVAALLAAHGLGWIFSQSCRLLERYNASLDRATHPRLVVAVMSVCFLVLNFMPGFNWPGAHAESTDHIVEYRMAGHEYDSMSVKTTFGDYRQKLRNTYNNCRPLDVHEDAFLEEVKGIVGSDLVINDPYDGSTLAYGAYGIRVYYRKAHGFGGESETPQSEAIRTNLADISSDDSVRQAVDDIGARYVLILDAKYSGKSFLRVRSNINDGAYDGISSITPDTPGFTEVLASGTCHLYRID